MRTLYRNDYCLSCEQVRVANQYRSFDVIHLYYIPLIPLGFRGHWFCTICGRNPRARTRTGKGVVIFLAVLVGLMAAGFYCFTFRYNFNPFLVRILKPPIDLKAMLKTVPPLSTEVCFFCGCPLDSNGYCSVCEIRLDQKLTVAEFQTDPDVSPWYKQ